MLVTFLIVAVVGSLALAALWLPWWLLSALLGEREARRRGRPSAP